MKNKEEKILKLIVSIIEFLSFCEVVKQQNYKVNRGFLLENRNKARGN